MARSWFLLSLLASLLQLSLAINEADKSQVIQHVEQGESSWKNEDGPTIEKINSSYFKLTSDEGDPLDLYEVSRILKEAQVAYATLGSYGSRSEVGLYPQMSKLKRLVDGAIEEDCSPEHLQRHNLANLQELMSYSKIRAFIKQMNLNLGRLCLGRKFDMFMGQNSLLGGLGRDGEDKVDVMLDTFKRALARDIDSNTLSLMSLPDDASLEPTLMGAFIESVSQLYNIERDPIMRVQDHKRRFFEACSDIKLKICKYFRASPIINDCIASLKAVATMAPELIPSIQPIAMRWIEMNTICERSTYFLNRDLFKFYLMTRFNMADLEQRIYQAGGAQTSGTSGHELLRPEEVRDTLDYMNELQFHTTGRTDEQTKLLLSISDPNPGNCVPRFLRNLVAMTDQHREHPNLAGYIQHYTQPNIKLCFELVNRDVKDFTSIQASSQQKRILHLIRKVEHGLRAVGERNQIWQYRDHVPERILAEVLARYARSRLGSGSAGNMEDLHALVDIKLKYVCGFVKNNLVRTSSVFYTLLDLNQITPGQVPKRTQTWMSGLALCNQLTSDTFPWQEVASRLDYHGSSSSTFCGITCFKS